MKNFIKSYIGGTITEVIRVLTSREQLEQHLRDPLYANAYYLMTSSAIRSILGFVFWVLAARLYSVEDVGLGSALIAAVSLLAGLASLGLGYGMIRFLPSVGNKATAMVNTCFTIGGLGAIVAALIFIAGLGIWSPALLFVRHDLLFFASFILFTLALVLAGLQMQVFIAQRSAKFVLITNVSASLLKLPLLILFVGMFGSFSIFASTGLGIAIMFIVALLCFLPRAQPGYAPFPSLQRQVINDMTHYSLGNYLADLLWSLPILVFPLMVVNILGAEMNAYFYIAWAVAGIIFIIVQAISYSLFAEGSHKEILLRSNTVRSLKMALLLLLPAILIILGLGDKILLLFGGAYSESGTTLLWILAFSAVPLTINYIYLSVLRVRKDIRGIIGLAAAIAVLALGLGYPLMAIMGLIGVGVGWLAAQVIVAAVVILLFIKRRPSGSRIIEA